MGVRGGWGGGAAAAVRRRRRVPYESCCASTKTQNEMARIELTEGSAIQSLAEVLVRPPGETSFVVHSFATGDGGGVDGGGGLNGGGGGGFDGGGEGDGGGGGGADGGGVDGGAGSRGAVLTAAISTPCAPSA